MIRDYLLLARYSLYNITGLFLLWLSYIYGYLGMVFVADPTGISALIFVVFVFGLLSCSRLVYHTSKGLNEIRNTNLDEKMPGSYTSKFGQEVDEYLSSWSNQNISHMRMHFANKIAHIKHIASSLVILGLIGTVIGFIIALSGVDPATASDIAVVPKMVASLVSGMSTALYTTLVGAILNVWLMINYYILTGGLIKLLSAVVK
jgi:biopolymer transport protein ExbB/TolQ